LWHTIHQKKIIPGMHWHGFLLVINMTTGGIQRRKCTSQAASALFSGLKNAVTGWTRAEKTEVMYYK
jgi:hypothetical protein